MIGIQINHLAPSLQTLEEKSYNDVLQMLKIISVEYICILYILRQFIKEGV
jgi:hypothetical protein